MTMCSTTNGFNSHLANNPYPATTPAPTAAAVRVMASEGITGHDQQQHAPGPHSTVLPVFDEGDDSAFLDLIISEDIDFTMDCFDAPPLDGATDDPLEGLL